MDLIAILLGVLFILFGVSLSWFISKRTKLFNNITQEQRHKNKILKDPELLIEKIKESVKKMNPTGKGNVRIIDNQEEIILGIKEEKGKKVLDIKRIPYKPTDKDMSPMMLASKVQETVERKKKDLEEKNKEEEQKQREQEQMHTRQEIEEANNPNNNKESDPKK